MLQEHIPVGKSLRLMLQFLPWALAILAKSPISQQSNVSACTSVDWAVRNQEEEIQELENKNLESGANFFWSWARDLLWCTFEAAANGKSWIMWSVFESSNAYI